MSIVKDITDKLQSLGFKVMEWQMPDTSVGIYSGFIAYEYEGVDYEVDWDYIQDYEVLTKEEILSNSELFED